MTGEHAQTEIRYTTMGGSAGDLVRRDRCSGGVTSAILNAVVAEELPILVTVFLNVDWNFTAPVRLGYSITGAVEVIDVRGDKPITDLITTVTRDDGETALDGTAVCYTMDINTKESK